jgi:hypothetical protein
VAPCARGNRIILNSAESRSVVDDSNDSGKVLSTRPVSGTLNADTREETVMHAKTGDHIVIETAKLDARRRHGDVLEVLGDQDNEHYRVRWDDGHESIYFPGPDAQLRPAD